MLNLLLTVPLQFACQLVGPGNSTYGNFTIVSNAPALQQRQTAELPDGYTAFPDVGAAYKYHGDDYLEWNEARKKCISEGGTLAIIDSWEKAKHAYSIVDDELRIPSVGIHSLYKIGEWTSMKSGLPLTSLPWGSGENPSTSSERCAGLHSATVGLAILPCDGTWSYLCEIPILANGRRLLPVPI